MLAVSQSLRQAEPTPAPALSGFTRPLPAPDSNQHPSWPGRIRQDLVASSPLPSSLHGNKLFISTFFCSLIAFLFTASEPQTRRVHWESLAIFFGPIFAYLPEFAGNKRLQLSFGCKNQKLKILRNKMSLYL